MDIDLFSVTFLIRKKPHMKIVGQGVTKIENQLGVF